MIKKRLPESSGDNKPPQIIIYETDDKVARVSVRLEDETVWLTNLQLSQLFNVAKATVSEHIKNIFDSGELSPDAVVRNFRTTAADGKSYDMSFYNLDMIPQVSGQNTQRRGKAISRQPQKRRNSRQKARRETTTREQVQRSEER